MIAGVGFGDQRCESIAEAREPFDLMLEAIRNAAADAGAPGFLPRASSVRVIDGVWPYQDPGRALAQEIGCPGAQSVLTPFSGTMVSVAIHDAARAVQRGDLDIVIIVAAECGYTRGRARKQGVKLEWRKLPGKPDLTLAPELEMAHPVELELGIRRPVEVYPMFDNALRHRDGISVEAHLDRLGALAAAFSEIAATNSHAWIQESRTADEISRPGPGNRRISFPYTLHLNSNNRVDQGAAIILCREETARQVGVPREKWVYPRCGTEADDCKFASERDSFSESAAVRFAGQKIYELEGIEPGDLRHVDLYSCFPSAVQVAARELALPHETPRTVTGGMTFAGGPMNCYVIRSTATMVERLRQHPGELGLVTGNGGYLAKHALTTYSTEPDAAGFRFSNQQARVDQLPKREVADRWAGECEVETYSVMYGSDGPDRAYVACRLPDGRRGWGICRDPDVMQAMTEKEFCGRAAERSQQAELRFV